MSDYTTALFVLILSTTLILYHHIGYPILLRIFSKRKCSTPKYGDAGPSKLSRLPSITIIVPAYNEESVIAAKIANLAALDYPPDLLRIVVALDACTDKTNVIAQAALEKVPDVINIEIVTYPRRMGKIAILNALIAEARSELVGLSDASALVEPKVLRMVARHFTDDSIGLLCATYKLLSARGQGERGYWDYQTQIKEGEAALAAPMGAHGAFYVFRHKAWSPLPPDTINDDFELPMRIVQKGYRAIYDRDIIATELEASSRAQEFWRRVRIGAGNMQQAVRFAPLADPRWGWLAFLFLSGKGLRPLIPFFVVLAFVATAVLAERDGSLFFRLLFLTELSMLLLAALVVLRVLPARQGILAHLGYAAEGYTASLLGALSFLAGRRLKTWQVVSSTPNAPQDVVQIDYIPRSVAMCKRGADVVLALLALCILVALFIPIALAIRFTSTGPILHRQLRVGRMTPKVTYLLELLKFRSMRMDAEAASGPVWAEKNDPRVTKVGAFLRKYRLDELPQCLNVLKGDMSVIGPRPERPQFFTTLEDSIPFYTERTFGLRPGITGLAQVNQEYDSSINDVRKKITYDHAYAMRLVSLRSWVKTDLEIILKTFAVMLGANGR